MMNYVSNMQMRSVIPAAGKVALAKPYINT